MTSPRDAEVQLAEPVPVDSRRTERGAPLYRLAGSLCCGEALTETVTTQIHVDASPECVWNRILFYEEVKGRPPFPLGALLPHPIRTEGDKTRAGATVQCIYDGGGSLVKRMTAVEPPRLLQFEVVEQSLGIEDCAVTLGGSYQIEGCGRSSHVALRTNYLARLHPRWAWRPVEALLVSQLHKHILRSLSAAVPSENRVLSPASLAPPRVRPGGLACKTQSCSHH